MGVVENTLGTSSMDQGEVTVELGTEWDDELRERISAAVMALGGSIAKVEEVLAGSQYLQRYAIVLPNGTLNVVAETYMGLYVSGQEAVVNQLVQALASQSDSKHG